MEQETTTQSPMNPSGSTSPAGATTETMKEHPGFGPLIGTAIILALMLVGGVYLFGTQIEERDNAADTLPLILGNEAPDPLPPTSSSDTVSDIEADVNTTDLDALDAQLDADLQAVDSAL